jgi:Spy/CpxP family protein refolding chaperone
MRNFDMNFGKLLTATTLSLGITLTLHHAAGAQLLLTPGTGQTEVEESLRLGQYDGMEAYLQQTLGLTDAQMAQIHTILESYGPAIQSAATDYFSSLEQLNVVMQPETDAETIRRARSLAVTKKNAIFDLWFERNMEIREVLNPDQRAQMNNALRAGLTLHAQDLLDLTLLDAAAFPDNLIDTNIEDAIAQLGADGWIVSARSPGSVFLDRGREKLDIEHDISGRIVNVFLR